MNDVDWLILGGGLHGVHVGARLIGEAGVEQARIRIIDPGDRLLARWRRFTAETGMSHLRSPGVHHLDVESSSLIKFAGNRRSRRRGVLRGIYNRPSLEIFNAHCDWVIQRFGLDSRHLRAEALAIEPLSDGVRVTMRSGEVVQTSQLVLAIGASCRPEWPEWAPRGQSRISHIFGEPSPAEDGGDSAPEENILVVGGGISAAQLALRLAVGGRTVDLVRRHPSRVHDFDSDPGWLGPKLMPGFRQERCPTRRRQILQRARYRGSVTPEVHRALKAAVSSGRVHIHEEDVVALRTHDDAVELALASGQELKGDRLVLATGFAGRRPGGEMLDRLAAEFDLPCASCGYPVVDPWLRWHPRIQVTGPLAELELGPVSRNIAGARRAGDRMMSAIAALRHAA
ncbi:MAG: FAD/NAD(P)-binding protein [Acidobacteriota bacterium]